MPPKRSGPWRIRVLDREIRVDTTEELVELVRTGRIGPATPVRSRGMRAWRPAQDIDEVATLLNRDPWSAWDAVENVDAETIWEEFAPTSPSNAEEDAPVQASVPPESTADLPEELPDSAMFPIETTEEPRPPAVPADSVVDETRWQPRMSGSPSRTPKPGDRPNSLSPGKVQPQPPNPAAQPAAPDTGGQVIAFPESRARRQMSGSLALASDGKNRPRAERKRQSSGTTAPTIWSLISWTRLGVLTFFGALGVSGWHWYVLMHSTAMFHDLPETAGTADLPPDLQSQQATGAKQTKPIADATPEQTKDSPYEAMEEDLRDRMMSGVLDVQNESQFEDALLIELRRVQLDIETVEVDVRAWAGRHQDIPESAYIRVRLRHVGEDFDRQLGAIGLIVGKYIQRYSLEVPRFEVIVPGRNRTKQRLRIDPQLSRWFYMERKTIDEFLAEGVGRP